MCFQTDIGNIWDYPLGQNMSFIFSLSSTCVFIFLPRLLLFFSPTPHPTCLVSPFSIAHGINNVCRALLWCKYLYEIRKQVWKVFANYDKLRMSKRTRNTYFRLKGKFTLMLQEDVNKQGKGLHFPPVLLMPWKLTAIILFFVNKGERMCVYTMLSFMYGIVEIQELLQPNALFLMI